MSNEAIAPLLTPEGWELLQSIPAYQPDKALTLSTKLRKEGWDPDSVAAALTQARLRDRAKVKFGEFAQHMLFTAMGLEQATRLPVAAQHAQRFFSAQFDSIADLGCGLGADAMACSALDMRVLAVEQDETTAACATINLMPFPHARVVHADAMKVDIAGVDAVWLDPSRRANDSAARQHNPETFSPPLSFATGLAAQGINIGVKLGPSLATLPPQAEQQWVALDSTLLEVTLWFNALKRPEVQRSALVLRSLPSQSGSTPDVRSHELTSPRPYDPSDPAVPLGPIEDYLYEPNPAVIRAGLVADLARKLGAHLLDRHIAYIGAASPIDSPFVRGYRILEVLPFDLKVLRAWVQHHGIGSLEIKKRGIELTPEKLRPLILPPDKKRGSGKATLILTRIGPRRVAFSAQPLRNPA